MGSLSGDHQEKGKNLCPLHQASGQYDHSLSSLSLRCLILVFQMDQECVKIHLLSDCNLVQNLDPIKDTHL